MLEQKLLSERPHFIPFPFIFTSEAVFFVCLVFFFSQVYYLSGFKLITHLVKTASYPHFLVNIIIPLLRLSRISTI